MESVPNWSLIVGSIGALLVGGVCHAHRRWQKTVERERFVLAMKAAATPNRLRPVEQARLHLLRAPWWALWRWLPERIEGTGRADSRY